MLKEFGLDWSMVASVVTDSGSDITFAFSNIPGVLREWCIAHLLNRAIIDAFGLSLSPEKSKNPQARRIVVRVKRVVKHTRKSDAAMASGLLLCW